VVTEYSSHRVLAQQLIERLSTGTELMFTFEKPGSFGIRFGLDGCVTDVTGQALAIGLRVDDRIVAVGGVRTDKKTLVQKLKVLSRPGSVKILRQG
jgi:hypothetical protein